MSPNHSNDKIFLIDTFAFIFRAYYANPRLKNGAAFTFSKLILQLIEKHQPKHLACIFDTPSPTFRDDLADDYKANRSEMPEDLIPQIPMIRDILVGLGIPMIELDGYEADDVLATLAEQSASCGMSAVIVSPDKDLLQLVRSPDITVLNTRDGEVWYDEEGVKTRMGVYPYQIVDFLTLVGDASDNVKGVPGIGEKGAVVLLNTYDTFQNIIDHMDDLKPRQQQGLKDSAPWIKTTKTLVTLVRDLELPLGPKDCHYQGLDREKAREVFKSLGFDSLMKTFTTTSGPIQSQEKRHYETISSIAQLTEAIGACRATKIFAIDTETTSLDPNRGHLVGISLAWKNHHGVYIPLAHLKSSDDSQGGALPGLTPESGLRDEDLDIEGDPQVYFKKIEPYLLPENLSFSEVFALLDPLLKDSSIKKMGQNLKYDIQVLQRHGFSLRGIAHDSMLLSYLCESNLRHNLDDLSARHLNIKPIAFEEVVGKGKTQKRFDQIKITQAYAYAAEDADLARRLCFSLISHIQDPKLLRLYEHIDLPLLEVLADIESTGFAVDIHVLKELSDLFTLERDQCESKAIALAGEPFNLNSPAQLGKILFEKMKLPVIRYTGKSKSPSTDEETLRELAEEHKAPIAQILLRHRELQKMLGTYVDALPLMINPVTKRIHTRLHQASVSSGRLASSDPNLQNIPVRTDEGKMIRKAFVPRQGWILIDADYSQIELRVAAALAQDPTLIEAFRNGEDIHQRTASEVMGIPLNEVTPDDRAMAKGVNFGLLYGQGPYALADSLGITFKEAKAFIEKYFERMPKVASWIEATKEKALASGEVRTHWGRIRKIPELESSNGNLRAQGLRVAVNTIIQGTAADIMRKAMVNLFAQLQERKLKTKILLQVHDELILESPPEEADAVIALLKDTMETADALDKLSVPLVADIRKGNNWYEAK